MKTKLHFLVATVLLALVATTSAQAQTTYYQATAASITTVATGTDYGFQSAYSSEYVAGTSLVSVLTDQCVYRFVDSGETVDGYPLYYLYHAASGSYVAAWTRTGVAVSYTADLSAAGKFTALEAMDYENGIDGREGTSVTGAGGEAVVITAESLYNESDYVYFSTGDSDYPTYNTSLSYNAVYVYPIAEATGLDLISLACDNYYPSGLDNITYGTNPGEADSTAYANSLAAYETAQAYINAGEVSDDDATTCAALLENTYNELIASIVPFREGYYYLLNGYGYTADPLGSYVAYEDTDENAIYWGWLTVPDSVELDDAVAIWHFIEDINEDGDTAYYVQNFYTGNYAGTTADVLYTAIPMTSSPEVRQTVVPYSGYSGYEIGWFNIYDKETWGENTEYTWFLYSWGVSYYPRSGYRYPLWKFVEVSDAEIEALTDAVAQDQLNTSLKSLYSEALNSYRSSLSYACENDIENGEIDAEGLVTSIDQLYTNKQETSEGPLANILDGDFSTFFHTIWSATTDGATAYLRIDLLNTYDCVAFKMAKRHNANPDNGSPAEFEIYATNDASLVGDDIHPDDTDFGWDKIGTYNMTYDYDYVLNGTTYSNFMGVVYLDLGADYRYLLMNVTDNTGGGATTNGNLYWYLSEFRVYDVTYDADNSPWETVSKDVRTEILAALAEAEEAIAAGAATEEIINRLQAAYNAFLAEYADPSVAVAAYNEAIALYEVAGEGTTPGYYAIGSMETFYNALQDAYSLISKVMSMDELNNCLAQIKAAVAEFKAALILPEEGKAYYIYSTSTQSSRVGKLIYAVNSGDNNSLLMGGYDVDSDLRDEDLSSRLNYAWTPEYDEDGNIALRNVFTGRYIQPTTVNYTNIYQTNEAATMTIEVSDLAGSFNFGFGNSEYLNCNGTYIISWSEATDVDSYWAFEEIENDPDIHIIDLSSSNLQPVTLALPIASEPANGGTIYRVLGTNADGNIVLEAANLELDEIPAGTPFLYQPAEGSTELDVYIDYGFDELTWELSPLSYNGLQGALQETTLASGYGIMSGGAVYVSVDGDATEANSGYFDGTTEETNLEGEAVITVNGEISAITAVGASAEAPAATGVYTLAGKKVGASTKNLPAGVYIAGGKKVLVK